MLCWTQGMIMLVDEYIEKFHDLIVYKSLLVI
jgi:hypothetical protein